jgi:hypothetical protein
MTPKAFHALFGRIGARAKIPFDRTVQLRLRVRGSLAFLRALTWPRLDLGSSISNARSRYQAAIFNNLALRIDFVPVI